MTLGQSCPCLSLCPPLAQSVQCQDDVYERHVVTAAYMEPPASVSHAAYLFGGAVVPSAGWGGASPVSTESGLHMVVPQLVPCPMVSRRVGLQPNGASPLLCPRPKYRFPDSTAQVENQPQATRQRRGARVLRPPPALSQISIQS